MKINLLQFSKFIAIVFVLIVQIDSKAQNHRIVCYGEEITYTFPRCDNNEEKYRFEVTNGTLVKITGDNANEIMVRWDQNYEDGTLEVTDVFGCYSGVSNEKIYRTVKKINVNSVRIYSPEYAQTDRLVSYNSSYFPSTGVNTSTEEWSVSYPGGSFTIPNNSSGGGGGEIPLDKASKSSDLPFIPDNYPELSRFYNNVDANCVFLHVSQNVCGHTYNASKAIQLRTPPPVIDSVRLVPPTCENGIDGKIIIERLLYKKLVSGPSESARYDTISYRPGDYLDGEFICYFTSYFVNEQGVRDLQDVFEITIDSLPEQFNYENLIVEKDSGNQGIELSKGTEVDIIVGALKKDASGNINEAFVDRETVSVNEDGPPIELELVATHPCQVGGKGSVSAQVTNGSGHYKFVYNGVEVNGDATQNFNFLDPMDYNIFVTDTINKASSIFGSVTVNSAPSVVLSSSVVTKNISCFGAGDGEISISASGGNEPFIYFENGSPVNNTELMNKEEGTYNITVVDNNNCHVTKEVTVIEPAELQITATDQENSTCGLPNGSASVINAIGGTGAYSYHWNNGIGSTSATVSNLPKNDYLVTVVDINGCTDTSTISVGGTKVPTVTHTNEPTDCSYSTGGGSLSIAVNNAEEPYNVNWYNMNGELVNPDNLAPGLYSAVLSDNVNCDYTFNNLEVTAPDELWISLTNYQRPICNNDNRGSLTVQGVGGTPDYKFKWIGFPEIGNTSTLSNLSVGTYQVEVTDAHDCVSLNSFDLVNTENVSFDIVDSVFICAEQSALIDAGNPGSTFDWSSSNGFTSHEQSVELTEEGDYSVIVTSPNGCTGQKEFHLTYDSRLFDVAFLISSESTIEDTLVLIEISWPIPDSVQWYIPSELTPLVDGMSYKELIPTQTGNFTVGMKAYLGGCNGMVEKQITILEAGEKSKQEELSQALIRKANLFPNPNTGVFDIDVELAKEADIQLDIYSMEGIKMQATRFEKGMKNYTVNYNLLSLKSGIYFISIIAGNEIQRLRFIVN